MTDVKSIESWWAKLFKRHRADKWTGGYALVEEVNGVIKQSTDGEKKEIIEFLTKVAIQKEIGYALALAVLESHSTPKSLTAIYEKAKTLKLSESEIVDYLRVLGKQGEDEHRPLLEKFLLSDPLNKNHSMVQWSVYPKFPELFAMSYSKYLMETNYEEWTGSAIVQAFMDRPEALKVLKLYLEKKNKDVWLKFRADIQEELNKDIWDKECKRKITKIL